MKHHHHPLRWIIWFLAAFFYFYEIAVRVAPSVMVTELMGALKINASSLGILSAFYFYAYSPSQIPIGVFTDRYGARRILTFGALITAIGALLFAISHHFWLASLGRFLMGFGSAGGIVGLIYIGAHWFEEKKRNLLFGFGCSIGALGAIVAQGPLRGIVDRFGWRPVNIYIGIFGLVLAVLLYLIIRNDPPEVREKILHHQNQKFPLIEKLKIVWKNKKTWHIAIISFFLYMTTPGFASLWGIPFVHEVYGISTELAGYAISMIFLGWAIGCPIVGHFSDIFRDKKNPLLVSSILGAVFMSVAIYLPIFPIPLLFFLFFLIGFVSSAQGLTFNYAVDLNPSFVKGTAASFVNFIVVIGSALSQTVVGIILDSFWTGKMDGAIRSYSPTAYFIALTLFPLSFLISFFLLLFLKKEEA